MKKSYHSKVVPAEDAATTVLIEVGASTAVGLACCVAASLMDGFP
jgi:hypothetical protein